MTLTERKNFLQMRISQEKCLIHDAKAQIDESEKNLRGLYGALETINEIEKAEQEEKKQRPAILQEQRREPSHLTDAVREAGAAEKAAFRAQVQDASQLGAP